MKVAFVHDWLVNYGGAERVLEAMLELFPSSPVYTLVHGKDNFQHSLINQSQIFSSFIQKLPKAKQKYQFYLPLMPLAIEQFDLSKYDLIISSSHAVAKGVLTNNEQMHISYIHTPVRYAWDLQEQYLSQISKIQRFLARPLLHYLRQWDVISSFRPDQMIANSQYISKRVEKTYRRQASVIYPPVDVDRFDYKKEREDFYLVVSRLVPYKRIDIIVEAFNQLKKPLVIIGDGSEMNKLKQIAQKNIIFLGQMPDSVVKDYLERCRAFVFAALEDFGIAPVEAQAAGAPVIAYGCGGGLETVTTETGLFFDEQTANSLIQAVEQFENQSFLPENARKNAEKFSKNRFKEELKKLIDRSLQ